jgi:hydroxyacylglutathione hydrolase
MLTRTKRRLRRAEIAVAAVAALVGAGIAGVYGSATWGVKGTGKALKLDDGVMLVAEGANAYIIPVGDGSAIAIDCGADPTARRMKNMLTDRGLVLAAIFLTHGHSEETAGCKALGAPLIALEGENDNIRGVEKAHSPVGRWFAPKPTGLRILRSLQDGAEITYGQRTFKVFAVPGHTSGSAAYLVGRTLYLGDAASAAKDGTVLGPAWATSDDPARGKESLHALATRLNPADIDTFAFSHSGPMPADVKKLAATQAP